MVKEKKGEEGGREYDEEGKGSMVKEKGRGGGKGVW